jgi:hypothetical protein
MIVSIGTRVGGGGAQAARARRTSRMSFGFTVNASCQGQSLVWVAEKKRLMSPVVLSIAQLGSLVSFG